MEYIDNLDGLVNIITNEEEVVIYGAGAISRLLIQYLKLTGYMNRVSCVAVKSKDNNPAQIEDVTVIKLDALGHYRECGCFIIATLPDKHEGIYEELKEFGCLKIKCISSSLIALISNNEKEYSLRAIENRIDILYDRLNDIEWRIEEQNELCSVHTETFSKYKNCHYGKDVVIVATGPTMRDYKPIENAVHIGVNGAWRREDIDLDYYFVQDGHRGNITNTVEGLLSGKIKGKIFIGAFLKRLICDSMMTFPEEIFMLPNVSKYFADSFPNGRNRSRDIYRDICYHPLADFCSIVFPALHFALYTYPKTIYLVGCDCSGSGYAYDAKYKSGIQGGLHHIRKGYALMKDFADLAYPQTRIVSVNPVGLKGLFEDMYTR